MAQELHNQKDAEYVARVAQPLILEVTDSVACNKMKPPDLKPETAHAKTAKTNSSAGAATA